MLLGKVMPCWVDVIRVERGRSKIGIIIKARKIVFIIHITQEISKQINKQTKEKKRKKI